MGFPGVEQEEWKYTNVASDHENELYAGGEFQRHRAVRSATEWRHLFMTRRATAHWFLSMESFERTFRRARALSGSGGPGSRRRAANQRIRESRCANSLERNADGDNNGFGLLNTALFAGGAFVNIPRGVTLHNADFNFNL